MADLYEVLMRSITVDAKGIDENGVEKQSRHWLCGSVVELSKPDADGLLAANAVKLAVDLPKEAAPPAEPPTKSEKVAKAVAVPIAESPEPAPTKDAPKSKS